jgi:hypothetical protein
VNSVRNDDASLTERLPAPDAMLPLRADAPGAADAPPRPADSKPEQTDLF